MVNFIQFFLAICRHTYRRSGICYATLGMIAFLKRNHPRQLIGCVLNGHWSYHILLELICGAFIFCLIASQRSLNHWVISIGETCVLEGKMTYISIVPPNNDVREKHLGRSYIMMDEPCVVLVLDLGHSGGGGGRGFQVSWLRRHRVTFIFSFKKN